MRVLIPIVLVTLGLSGCSAGRASVALVQADQAITHARSRGAADEAVFELRMAEAYLIKAREEAHSSSYRRSVELSRGAADWADKAVIVMETAGTASGGEAPQPAPAPDTAPTLEETPDAGGTSSPDAPPARDPFKQDEEAVDAATSGGAQSRPDAPASEDTDAPPRKVIVVPLPEDPPEEPAPKVIIIPRDEAPAEDAEGDE